MRTTNLTRRLAHQTRVSQAEAADQLDRVIHEILVNLRKGARVKLPGLGEFRPDADFVFQTKPGGSKPDAS